MEKKIISGQADRFAPENLGLDTLAVRAGYDPESQNHSATLPIYQTNSYQFESVQYAENLFALKTSGNIYTRLTNPTVSVLEERINAMEGGAGAVAMASGHAAIFNTILNLAGAGDEIVSSIRIYGGAVNLLGVTLKNIGIHVKFVDPDDFDAWENAINEHTKALFVEVIGNPNANVSDIERIAEIAHRHSIPLIVDSTMTTPYLIRPIQYGADIVIHSATKFLSGQGNAMAGIVVDGGNFKWHENERFPMYNTPDPSYHGVNFGTDCKNAGFIARMRALLLRDIGACLSPFNAFLVAAGMETLTLRMRRHCDNALTIAQYLSQKEQINIVNYPGLCSNRYHQLAEKYMPKGTGSVFTFELKGNRDTGARFIENLRLFMHVANLGDARSLVSHPASTTHSQLSEHQLQDAGISSGTIRLSIGIEDPNDLIADLEQAIHASIK